MTGAEWRVLEEYVRARADDLGLKDWSIEVERSPAQDDKTGAEINPIRGRKHTKVALGISFREYKPAIQRAYIVHELIHLHFEVASAMVRDDLDGARVLAHGEDSLFWAGYKRLMEYAVDGLAAAIAPKFPLIQWPKNKKR